MEYNQHRNAVVRNLENRGPGMRQKPLERKLSFDEAPNKCLQQAILALAQNTSPNVHAVLLRMFRTSCANASASGSGRGRQSEANLYSTQHALRHVGVYVLVHSEAFENGVRSSKVSLLGSTAGFCVGSLTWNNQTHHVEPLLREEALNQSEVASVHDFAPWELGHVGAKEGNQACDVAI